MESCVGTVVVLLELTAGVCDVAPSTPTKQPESRACSVGGVLISTTVVLAEVASFAGVDWLSVDFTTLA